MLVRGISLEEFVGLHRNFIQLQFMKKYFEINETVKEKEVEQPREFRDQRRKLT